MTKCLLCSRNACHVASLSATMGHAMSSECLASGDVYAPGFCLHCACCDMLSLPKAQAMYYKAELMSRGVVASLPQDGCNIDDMGILSKSLLLHHGLHGRSLR